MAINSAIGVDSRARYRAGKAAHPASPSPSPPPATSANVRHDLDVAAYNDNGKATEKKFRRRRRIFGSVYFLPCLGAAVSVLILVIDMRWTAQERSVRRGASATTTTTTAAAATTAIRSDEQEGKQQPIPGATGEGNPAVGSLGKTSHRLNAPLVPADADPGTSNDRFRARQHPPEVSLDDLRFIDGQKALVVGNRFRSHLNSEGRPLSWWTQSRRQHDNYASDLNFDMPLEITFLDAQHFRREVRARHHEEQSLLPPSLDSDDRALPAEKNYDQYDEPMDDDVVVSNLFTRKNENRQCRQPEWYRLQFPTCNSFHEVTMVHSGSESSYLGKGYFRMAFSIVEKNQPWFILKVMRWRKEKSSIGMFSPEYREKTRVDGLVMERLSASPRITDMYGFCATSVMTEPLPGEIWEEAVPTERTIQKHELRDKEHLDPKNKYTPTEKIEMALDLAEALAELHGFADGMIVHDDIDLGQYLRTPDGRIKLNDFNRAKVQLWDPIKEEHSVCASG